MLRWKPISLVFVATPFSSLMIMSWAKVVLFHRNHYGSDVPTTIASDRLYDKQAILNRNHVKPIVDHVLGVLIRLEPATLTVH